MQEKFRINGRVVSQNEFYDSLAVGLKGKYEVKCDVCGKWENIDDIHSAGADEFDPNEEVEFDGDACDECFCKLSNEEIKVQIAINRDKEGENE